ncbi:MAG: thiol oxidoreductase [Saprospiraceae bacterium]|nr:thiol oxidoreductase [Saprospiraceae bacterium]
MKIQKHLILATSLCFALQSCDKILPEGPAENEVLDGTVEGLTIEEQLFFGEGDEAFAKVFTAEDGLGPIFVETSCISCHIGDGRGHPFSELMRFALVNPNGTFDHLEAYGGPQLQHRSLPGFLSDSIPTMANGTTALLAPPSTGLGFLEAVPDATLLALADPNDQDGDGISGVVSYIDPPDFYRPFSFNTANADGKYIGRFGRKAGAIDLLMQTVGAYQQDMGITSEFLPNEPQGANIAAHEPDVSTEEVQAVVFYLQTLKAPERRNEDDPDIIMGQEIFSTINCSGCHTPQLETGDAEIAVLNNVIFYPYTDLLLHDMGPELDDNYTEGSATTAEWRTTPLWGLGLAPDAQGGAYFLMHDGRATSIDEAIQMHGGEGSNSREAYNALSESEKNQLIAFLESL